MKFWPSRKGEKAKTDILVELPDYLFSGKHVIVRIPVGQVVLIEDPLYGNTKRFFGPSDITIRTASATDILDVGKPTGMVV